MFIQTPVYLWILILCVLWLVWSDLTNHIWFSEAKVWNPLYEPTPSKLSSSWRLYSSYSMPVSNFPLYNEIWWEIFLGIGQGEAQKKNKRKECMGSSLDQCSSDFRSCESPGEFLKMHILFQKVRTGSWVSLFLTRLYLWTFSLLKVFLHLQV